MDTLLTNFQLDRPTWFYLSLLLIVALFFRFTRVWSLRNFDLALLLAPTPGLLMVERGYWSGFVVLLAAGVVILVRVLVDPYFRRRPRTAQNLNTPGLAFLAIACGVFHVAEIATTPQLPEATVRAGDMAARLIDRNDRSPVAASEPPPPAEPSTGPAAAVLSAPLIGLSQVMSGRAVDATFDVPMRLAAIFAHLGVVSALLVLGWRGFGDLSLGVAMSALYLLLPYTAYDADQISYVLPGALILWAAVCMRNPFLAGGLMGLACGTLFFPVFLLPIWISFYGFRNAARFLFALASVWIILLGSIALTTADSAAFIGQLVALIDRSIFDFSGDGRSGIWNGVHGAWRMPVFALFIVMVCLLCWWPRRRSMEHLLTRLTAVIVGIQFWYPHAGGVYVLWYAPLLIAIIFRPALSQWIPPAAPDWPWQRGRQPTARAASTTSTSPIAAADGTPHAKRWG